MKKLKLLIIPALTLLLCGCGNRDMWDTNYTFHKAICEIGGEYKEIKIKQWSDYDGEQIQIISKDGNTYLVSMNNCTLIKEY
ncbi:MAG: hypothetical protein IJ501_06625 [Bacilli bacterium]|nr:hypothetical protein [Bacilli bacterium]